MAGDGTVTYLLSRSVSEDSLSWEADSVWTVRKTAHQVVMSENNTAFVKLTFPVRAGNTWDGNAANTMAPQSWFYQETEPFVLPDQIAEGEEVIRVVIEDIPENLVNRDERSEIYVRGTGLVEKDYITLRFDSESGNIGEISSGHILSQRLIGYEEK